MSQTMPCPNCGRPDIPSKRLALPETTRHYECEQGHRFHIPFRTLRRSDAEIAGQLLFQECNCPSGAAPSN